MSLFESSLPISDDRFGERIEVTVTGSNTIIHLFYVLAMDIFWASAEPGQAFTYVELVSQWGVVRAHAQSCVARDTDIIINGICI